MTLRILMYIKQPNTLPEEERRGAIFTQMGLGSRNQRIGYPAFSTLQTLMRDRNHTFMFV